MRRRRRAIAAQDGFSLIEAIVAVGIFSIAIGGMIAAMLAVLKPMAESRWSAQLTTVAQNVLTDLRAASAYDTAVLAAAEAKRTTFTVPDPSASGSVVPPPLSVTVTYVRPNPGAPMHAVVQVADAQRHVVRVDGVLVHEAPYPGEVVAAGPPLSMPTPIPQATPIYIYVPLPMDAPPNQSDGGGGGGL